MAAAYGVPLGGALFALEVLRGDSRTALRAAGAGNRRWSRPACPGRSYPTRRRTTFPNSTVQFRLPPGRWWPGRSLVWSRCSTSGRWRGPIATSRQGWRRLLAPVVALALLGAVSIPFPQLLGNGRDVAELAFTGQLSPLLLVVLTLLRPAATLMCLGSGAPGGLFTPSLALGALLGGVLGLPWSWLWPGVPPGLFALLGSAAMLAAWRC